VLRPRLRSLAFEQKVAFLFAFSLCTKPLKYHSKVHKRRRYEFKELAAALLLQLDLWDLKLSHQTVSRLVFALAKLQLENTRFITHPIRDYISEQLEDYCQDKDRLFQAIAYLGQLEAGVGLLDQELAGRLRALAEPRWG
jgi:hypothetical protein